MDPWMTAILNQDFVTYAGDDVFPIFTVKDSAGNAVDISTVTEISWAAIRNSDAAVAVTRTKTAGQIAFVTNGTDGKFQVTIPKAVTAGLSGFYRHTATITDSLGNVTTVEVGRMQVGVKPAWTYDATAIATSSLYQTRRLLGDVIKEDPQLTDEEINYFLTLRSSVHGAAAEAARSLAAQYSRKVDVTSPGPIQTRYSTQAESYAKLAVTLDQASRDRGAGITPFAGGISISDKQNRQQDTDRVQPAFNIGFTDNLTLPAAPVGQETPTQPMSSPTANQ
jgi:hypothetical protein